MSPVWVGAMNPGYPASADISGLGLHLIEVPQQTCYYVGQNSFRRPSQIRSDPVSLRLVPSIMINMPRPNVCIRVQISLCPVSGPPKPGKSRCLSKSTRMGDTLPAICRRCWCSETKGPGTAPDSPTFAAAPIPGL